MKLIIPNNIFATLLILSLEENNRPELEVKESSLIATELATNKSSVGLLPCFDLIKNNELFVSANKGIAFDGPLSNSYMYFGREGKLDQFNLRGDLTTNEVILSKIVMQERYEISPEFSLDTEENIDAQNNYLISGSENWTNKIHERGISFSEQVSELINFPYQNFIFASHNEDSIKEVNKLFEKANESVVNNLDELLGKISLSDDVNELVRHELEGLYYKTEDDWVTELLNLAYYHQIIDDMFDVKFI